MCLDRFRRELDSLGERVLSLIPPASSEFNESELGKGCAPVGIEAYCLLDCFQGIVKRAEPGECISAQQVGLDVPRLPRERLVGPRERVLRLARSEEVQACGQLQFCIIWQHIRRPDVFSQRRRAIPHAAYALGETLPRLPRLTVQFHCVSELDDSGRVLTFCEVAIPALQELGLANVGSSCSQPLSHVARARKAHAFSAKQTSQRAPPLDIPAEPLAGCQYLFGALRAPRTAMRSTRYEIPTTRRIAVQRPSKHGFHSGLIQQMAFRAWIERSSSG